MPVVLDTDSTPTAKRAGAISDVMVYASAPCDVVHEDGPTAWARMSYTEFSPGAHCFNHAGSGLSLVRNARHLRSGSPERLSIAVHGAAPGGHAQGDSSRRLHRRELIVTDLTAPYEYFWTGDGRAVCFLVDYAQLELPVDMVRTAASQLESSPLYFLVRDHIEQLCADAEALAVMPDSARVATADATTGLIRALVSTAVDRASHNTMVETLPARLQHYLQHHLGDGSLDAATLAARHDLSLLQFRRTWSQMNMGAEFEDWLVAQRLARVSPSDPVAGRGYPARGVD